MNNENKNENNNNPSVSLDMANIIHDMRNGLSMNTLLIDKVLSINKYKDIDDTLHKVKYNIYNSIELADQMLSIFTHPYQNSSLFVNDNIVLFIDNIIDIYKEIIEAYNLDFIYTNDANVLITYFDPQKIEKILLNIFDNALKYTKKNGSINVSMFVTNQNTLHLKIKNTKSTEDYVDADNIFKLFDRIEHNETGIGLGLSICKNYIDDHGGNISVNQTSNWIEFEISLPVIIQNNDEEKFKLKEWNYNLLYHSQEKHMSYISSNTSRYLLEDIIFISIIKDYDIHLLNTLNESYNIIFSTKFNFDKKNKIIKTAAIIFNVSKLTSSFLSFIKFLKTNIDTKYIPIIIIIKGDSNISEKEFIAIGVDFCFKGLINANELLFKIKVLTFQKKLRLSLFSKNIIYNNLVQDLNNNSRFCLDDIISSISLNYTKENKLYKDISAFIPLLPFHILLDIKHRFDKSYFIFIANMNHLNSFKSNLVIKKINLKNIFLEIICKYDFYPHVLLENLNKNKIYIDGLFLHINPNTDKLTILKINNTDLEYTDDNAKNLETPDLYSLEQYSNLKEISKAIHFYFSKNTEKEKNEFLSIHINQKSEV